MMGLSRVSRQRSLIAAFAVVMVAFMWPAPASAQFPHPEGCGYCRSEGFLEGRYHYFRSLGMTHRCDNLFGCHSSWYSGYCSEYHHMCYITRPASLVESAIDEANPAEFAELLTSLEDWEYSSAYRALSLRCSGYTIARYVLPEELVSVANLWATEKLTLRPDDVPGRKAGL